MASIVNLHARPGEGAELTLWRTGITNADSTVTLTIDPALAGATAVAFTDASGDDQGRIDISIPDDTASGAYQWTAEIDSVEVFSGTIYIAPHGRPTSFLAHSIDIRSLTTPAWIIDRPEDVEGEPVGGGAAEQLIETGGPTTLDIDAIPDGSFLKRDGATIVGDTPAGGGDVTAASTFTAINRLVVAADTAKGVKDTLVTVNGAAVSGVSTLGMTGALTGATAITTGDLTATGTITGISAADVGADASGTAVAAVTAHEGEADPHPVYQLLSEKGDPNGYASLDGDGLLAEPATMVVETSGPTILTFGAVADGQFVKRVGDDLVGDNPAGSGDVTGPAGATVDSVPTLDATGKVLTETPVLIDSATGDVSGVGDLSMAGAITGATAITTTDLTASGTITGISAADVGADAAGTAAAAIATHIGLADPHTQYQKESEKGSASGYASLNADTHVVEPALSITDGTTTFTVGTLTDTQILYLDGTTIKTKTVSGSGDVTGPAGSVAEAVPVLDATGKVLSETPVLIDTATGDVTGVNDLTMAGDLTGAALVSATAGTFTDLTATGTITGISAADVGADASGTAAAAVVTHVGLADPHTQYQLESEKGSANGYAGLDASGYMTAPSTKVQVTGATLDWAGVTDGHMVIRSGTNLTSQAIPSAAAGHLVGNAIPASGLGNNGDVYERLVTGDYWAKSGGAWSRSNLFASMPGMSSYTFEVLPRNNSGTLTNSGGQASSTAFGSATGVTYATTNARTSHIRVAFNGATTANTVCSGVITPQQSIIHVGSSSRHGRFMLKFRFGLASVVAANFRFFAGVITTAGTFSDDPTGAGSVLGDRIGLAVDANTALAAKWLVNYSGANQNNTAAYTLVQDNWYELVIWTAPLSNVIHMELWEQTTANGALSMVASIDFAVTSDIVDMVMRPFLAAANAGTAAACCNVHFGGLMGRCFYTS